MQHFQGIHYTYVSRNRSELEKLQDLLYVFYPFTNGVTTTLLMDLYHDTLSGCKELVNLCVEKGLLEETQDGVYNRAEKGTKCNTFWYAIRDRFELGEVKKREIISDSIITSVIHVEPLPPDKERDKILDDASNYRYGPKFPFANRFISRLQTHIFVLKEIRKRKITNIATLNSEFRNLSYEELLRIRDEASLRGYIELIGINGTEDKRKKYSDMHILYHGTDLLNTINWYLNEFKMVEFFPLRIKPSSYSTNRQLSSTQETQT